jgi:ribosome-binding ATPase
MEVVICGPATTGKSIIFTALSQHPPTTNPDRFEKGEIKVPDERIDRLSEIFQPKKTTYPAITFCDTTGPMSAKTRSGINNHLIETLWQADLLTIVLGQFLPDSPPPKEQLQVYIEELVFTDLVRVDARLEKMAKEKDKNQQEEKVLKRCKEHLENNVPLFTLGLTHDEKQHITHYNFVTAIPMVALVNLMEGAMWDDSEMMNHTVFDIPLLALYGQLELEVTELDPEEQQEFLEGMGINESARARFVRLVYDRMNLQSFLTIGEDEVRGWTIQKGTPAVQAAGKIHTDLEKGFIRAEVMPYAEFMEYKSQAKMREAGKLQVVGKDYIVQDGDILNIRFNL